ncbi:hypothetical protein ABIH81_24345 [Micromonospora sp. HUAS YX12]|uniref:Uncharacterized protein n=1 Tax=Micromonospora sp. HUAS YX12 TaxID=3156396 RepID=A0AAU7QWZ6_9ACTN
MFFGVPAIWWAAEASTAATTMPASLVDLILGLTGIGLSVLIIVAMIFGDSAGS